MAKDLKKLARQLKREKEEEEARLNKISPKVTNMPSGLSEHLGEKFKLIFQYYNHSECEMISMTKDEMKRVINTFTKITKHDQNSISKICRPKSVKRAGVGSSYANLFNGLPDDFDSLLEVDFTGTGRVFIYPYKNMCCVIAVDKKHR